MIFQVIRNNFWLKIESIKFFQIKETLFMAHIRRCIRIIFWLNPRTFWNHLKCIIQQTAKPNPKVAKIVSWEVLHNLIRLIINKLEYIFVSFIVQWYSSRIWNAKSLWKRFKVYSPWQYFLVRNSFCIS